MRNLNNSTDPFEQQVLEAVSNIPIEYNPKNWERLSKELDKELPVSEGSSLKTWKSNIFRTGLYSCLIGLVLSTTYSTSKNTEINPTRPTNQSEIDVANDGSNLVDTKQHSNSFEETVFDLTTSQKKIKVDPDPALKDKLAIPLTDTDHSAQKRRKKPITQSVDTINRHKGKDAEKDSLFLFW